MAPVAGVARPRGSGAVSRGGRVSAAGEGAFGAGAGGGSTGFGGGGQAYALATFVSGLYETTGRIVAGAFTPQGAVLDLAV